MPVLWRYLLRNYIQVFFLCVAGFISVLLVTRFQDIARFAATGASQLYILKFIGFQIPFILPLAIPISCLIAAILLFQNLSRSHELTALRVSGLGLKPIIFPLLVVGCLLTVLNFAIVSEIAPKCRSLSKSLAYQMTAINPLCLLQKQTLIKLKNTYVDMKVLKSGKYAEDVAFIMRNSSNDRLGLMLAKKLSLKDSELTGTGVTFISSIDPKKSDCYDHLVIENQSKMQTGAAELAQYLRKSDWNVNYDYLNLRMLQAKYVVEKGKGAKFNSRAWQELARRISLGLAAFTFTLVGIAFGMEISRVHKLKKIMWAVGLTAFYLIAFVGAKSMKHNWLPSTILFLAPHPIILFFCLRSFKQIAKGAE